MPPKLPWLATPFIRDLNLLFRRACAALNMNTPKPSTKPFSLINFDGTDKVKSCKIMSDQDVGGFSTFNMVHRPATKTDPSHAFFYGNISTRLPKDKNGVQRSGYVGWRTQDQRVTVLGRLLWDLQNYPYLAILFNSDNRRYFINAQTDSMVRSDVYQHKLVAQDPGNWEIMVIPWDEFVRTNHGQAVQPQNPMPTSRIFTVGISCTSRIPGDFALRISKMWATNCHKDDHHLEDFDGRISGLPEWHTKYNKSPNNLRIRRVLTGPKDDMQCPSDEDLSEVCAWGVKKRDCPFRQPGKPCARTFGDTFPSFMDR